MAVTTVASMKAASVFSTAGSVVADTSTRVASRFSAYVRALPKKEGDVVRIGDVLVELDSRDVTAAISAAQGKVNAARAAAKDAADDFAKYSVLYKDGLVSNQNWRKIQLRNEGAKADLAQAEAMLSVARTQADYLTIKAERDGHVASVLKHEGDLALPGLPILVTDTDAGAKFEFHVPEEFKGKILPGMPATIAVEGVKDVLVGRIERVSESADRISRSYLARAVFEGAPAVRPGMYGRLTATLGEGTRPAVPACAVTERGGLTGVFVVENGRALFHWLKLGTRTTDSAEVLAGLAGGEMLVSNPSALLYDGAPVTVSGAGK